MVATPSNLAALKGTSVYAGYGFGATTASACADMLDKLAITSAYAYSIN